MANFAENITKLEKLLERITLLRQSNSSSIEFKKWKRDTEEALRFIYGESSHYFNEFKGIAFGLYPAFGPTDVRRRQASYIGGLDDAQILLETLIEENQEYQNKESLDNSLSNKSRGRTDMPAKQVQGFVAQGDRNVFVVHGRNLVVRDALFRFLRSIGLRPLEWSQAVEGTGKASPYVGEILDAAFAKAQAVVVLMTPDDKVRLRNRLLSDDDPAYEMDAYQARPNVLFEAGMAIGRAPDRTVLVEVGKLRPFSDVGGRHVIRLNNTTQKRQELAMRLEQAGCPVDLSGTDWHSEGDFSVKD